MVGGLMHFPFARSVVELPQTVAITFNLFDDLGDRHVVLGIFVYIRTGPFGTSWPAIESLIPKTPICDWNGLHRP